MPEQNPNRLLLDRCPECGYLLTGLPPEGQCPECGFAYNADMIVLYGWGFGQKATAVNRRRLAMEIVRLFIPEIISLAGAVAALAMARHFDLPSGAAWMAMLPFLLQVVVSGSLSISRSPPMTGRSNGSANV